MTKLNPSVLALLQSQLTAERHANATYLALSAAFVTTAYQGIARFFAHSASEELEHHQKFFDYLADRNEIPAVSALEAVSVSSASPLEAFNAALELETTVTKLINALCIAAYSVGDHQTCAFLKWFLDEQTASERELQNFIDSLTLAASDPSALLAVDRDAALAVK